MPLAIKAKLPCLVAPRGGGPGPVSQVTLPELSGDESPPIDPSLAEFLPGVPHWTGAGLPIEALARAASAVMGGDDRSLLVARDQAQPADTTMRFDDLTLQADLAIPVLLLGRDLSMLGVDGDLTIEGR